MAREAGIGESHEFDDLEDFVSELPVLLAKVGPVFICLKVENASDAPGMYMNSTRDAMRRVMKTLGTG